MLSLNKETFTVTQLNKEARDILLNKFSPVWVEGEISNLAAPSSGHLYFSLKDNQSQVRCAMFRAKNQSLKFALEQGLKVVVYARVDLYTARGDFQLIVDLIEPTGAGEIQKRFEMLKQKLDKEGLFASEKKRAIPSFPNSVGIITSEKGAALRDIINVFRKRRAFFNIIIYPSLVQGKAAAASLLAAVNTANQRQETEVLIVARGGGSLEDLDTFNDEKLVRTLATSKIPIVSGIGHEIDFTLADFVADFRTPTPTAAAVKVCPDSNELEQQLGSAHKRLSRTLQHQLDVQTFRLQALKKGLTRLHPQTRIEELIQRFDEVWERLVLTMRHTQATRKMNLVNAMGLFERCSPLDLIEKLTHQLKENNTKLTSSLAQYRVKQRYLLRECEVKLYARNPLALLKSGYSVITNEQGAVIRSVDQTKPGQAIDAHLEKGIIRALVKKTISRK